MMISLAVVTNSFATYICNACNASRKQCLKTECWEGCCSCERLRNWTVQDVI